MNRTLCSNSDEVKCNNLLKEERTKETRQEEILEVVLACTDMSQNTGSSAPDTLIVAVSRSDARLAGTFVRLKATALSFSSLSRYR